MLPVGSGKRVAAPLARPLQFSPANGHHRAIHKTTSDETAEPAFRFNRNAIAPGALAQR